MDIKFKRIAQGLYDTKYKGYEGDVSRNYEARNWSWEVRDPQGSLIDYDVVSTYKDAKWCIRQIIEERTSK